MVLNQLAIALFTPETLSNTGLGKYIDERRGENQVFILQSVKIPLFLFFYSDHMVMRLFYYPSANVENRKGWKNYLCVSGKREGIYSLTSSSFY